MARMFDVVLIIGIVDDTLQVAFVVADFHSVIDVLSMMRTGFGYLDKDT